MQSHRIIPNETLLVLSTYFHMPPKPSQSSRIWFNLQKSIHHNMMEHTSLHESKCSKKTSRRPFHIQNDPHSLSHYSPFSFFPSSPSANTQARDKTPCSFVTDALVLPCQLLVLLVTIWCYPAACATERNRPVPDSLFARVTTELAFGQVSIQVQLEMTICLMFVTIEVEELSLGKVHFGGNLINLQGTHFGVA